MVDVLAIGCWAAVALMLSVWGGWMALQKNRSAPFWALAIVILTFPAWLLLRQLPAVGGPTLAGAAPRRWPRLLMTLAAAAAGAGLITWTGGWNAYARMQSSVAAQAYADVYHTTAEAHGSTVQIDAGSTQVTLTPTAWGWLVPISVSYMGILLGLTIFRGQPVATLFLAGWALLLGYLADVIRCVALMRRAVEGEESAMLLWPLLAAMLLIGLMAAVLVEHVWPAVPAFAQRDKTLPGEVTQVGDLDLEYDAPPPVRALHL